MSLFYFRSRNRGKDSKGHTVCHSQMLVASLASVLLVIRWGAEAECYFIIGHNKFSLLPRHVRRITNCCRRKSAIIQLIPSTISDCPFTGCPQPHCPNVILLWPHLFPGLWRSWSRDGLLSADRQTVLWDWLYIRPLCYWFALLDKKMDVYRKGRL